jgi:hypothetical protein
VTDADRMLADIDALAMRIAGLALRVQTHVEDSYHQSRHDGLDASYRVIAADPDRWLEIGRDHLQQGLMCLRRAVQRPDSF